VSVFRDKVIQIAGRIAKVAELSSWGTKWGHGRVTTSQTDQTEQQTDTQEVRFYGWQGFRVKPKLRGTQAVVLAPRGGSSGAVAVACDDLTAGPTPTEELEPVIYDGAGSTIAFRADKSVEIKAASGASAVLDSSGNVTVLAGPGAVVRLGTDLNPLLSGVLTEAHWTAIKATLIAHTHPETGTTTLPSADIGPLSILSSPNVKARTI